MQLNDLSTFLAVAEGSNNLVAWQYRNEFGNHLSDCCLIFYDYDAFHVCELPVAP